ncbi:hypothetical protein LINPERPRIM_LOCUS42592, partial [Linum perenne]
YKLLYLFREEVSSIRGFTVWLIKASVRGNSSPHQNSPQVAILQISDTSTKPTLLSIETSGTQYPHPTSPSLTTDRIFQP